MALAPGTRIGAYSVLEQIGEGGMGEVYRATDPRLKRDVAIKVLPGPVAADADRLARFQREAEVLASLNHPGIAHLYGIEDVPSTSPGRAGSKALVMELVEGPTLADRIAHGPVPVDEALPIARQIAGALEAAHAQGVIHRDLKPANIKLRPDGTVKVLDFGLAKAMDPGPVAQSGGTMTPTLTTPAMTQAGLVLGTAAYMSPEQARGRAADRRSDVWAFGVVLYEMLAGRRAFGGDDTPDTVASVLKVEPRWDALPGDVPPVLAAFLKRCLAKDPKERIHDIADVRLAIDGAFDLGAPAPAVTQRPRSRLALPVAAAIGGVVTGALVWLLTQPGPPAPLQVTRFAIETPPEGPPPGPVDTLGSLDLSPSGDVVVYAAGQDAEGNRQIFLRRIEDERAVALRGTEGGLAPFFSADGQSVGFFSPVSGGLFRVPVSGGPAGRIVTLAAPAFGMHWTPDDMILFSRSPSSPLLRVPATGGEIEALTELDVEAGEVYHARATLLPDGDTVLFTVFGGPVPQLAQLSLGTREVRRLGIVGSTPQYSPTGHVLFVVPDGTLRALPYDLDRREFTSTNAIPLEEGLALGPNTLPGNYRLAANGSLVYLAGSAAGTGLRDRILVIVGPDGRIEEQLDVAPAPYLAPRISPDGRFLAVQINGADGSSDIWIQSLADNSRMRRLTLDGRSSRPVWTPDSARVTFASVRDSAQGIFWQSIAGGAAERLTTAEGQGQQWPDAWSPDGLTLGYSNVPPTGNLAEQYPYFYSVVTGETTAVPAFASGGGVSFSADGKWFAYHGTQTGAAVPSQIYVQPFPPTGADVSVTPAGGTYAVFAKDGRLSYRRAAPIQATVDASSANPTEIVTIDLNLEAGVTFGQERILTLPGIASVFGYRDFDPVPGGGLIVALYPEASGPVQAPDRTIHLVLNWVEVLRRQLPAR